MVQVSAIVLLAPACPSVVTTSGGWGDFIEESVVVVGVFVFTPLPGNDVGFR